MLTIQVYSYKNVEIEILQNYTGLTMAYPLNADVKIRISYDILGSGS